MKKKEFIFISALLFVLTSVHSTYAMPYYFGDARNFAAEGINTITNLLSPFLESIIGDYNTSEFFFSKVLLLILLVIIITKVLEKTPIGEKSKKVNIIIALLISIISIRFINENNFFESIFIQYGVLGIAITTILPMVIFFYFIHNTQVGTFGRKVFWAIYTITLTAIWISKSSELSKVANWIYGLSILATVIFILLDKTIHSYFGLTDFKKFEKKSNEKAIRNLKRDLVELAQDRERGIYDWDEYKEKRDAIFKAIKDLSKD